MEYAQLLKEFKSGEPYELPHLALESQPRLAVMSSVLSLGFISLALVLAYSKTRFPVKLLLYALVSFLGSLFAGSAAVFLADSFGVYV
ncbi:hypothetical protein HG536_0D05730 [Torulaspora globosa]|uniref:Dolichyl-diphosphooligosaccharide-protein glycosyltransferase subunit OST5 n=1 Tax=Torulaspora globosa TaxID=48254 RepID=A0A7G3ZHR6_9SACH|nr:uncharacterized protein HG536_0D05730 [Torulaspora globosa]QLL33052.1 hypothetical protein HG536_0D05730 [Torulaspora globosa]